MKLYEILCWILLIYLSYKLIFKHILPFLFKRLFKKLQQHLNDQVKGSNHFNNSFTERTKNTRKEKTNNPNRAPKVGDYIDFEEIDD